MISRNYWRDVLQVAFEEYEVTLRGNFVGQGFKKRIRNQDKRVQN